MTVSPDDLVLARASYDRCCAAPDFFVCFYRNLFKLAPQTEPRFANTDFTRQHKLLRHALGLLLSFPTEPDTEPTILRRVADRHGRTDLDIPPEWYGAFVDALLQTVTEHDGEYTDAVDAAWRRSIEPGIEYMKARYEQ